MKTIIENPNYQLIESVHTKKGNALYVIQLKNRVEDKFKLVSRRVDKQGGYYSGHQKGFVFNRILSENELNELFKGIFFEDKIELQKVDEEKDAWKYTTEELKSFPFSKRDDNTFVFKYKSDGNEKSYSVKVTSGSIDDAALLFGKQIIGNTLLEKKYNQAVEKGEMTPVRAAQIIKSIGYSLSEINEDFIELHPDIQSVWSMKKSNEGEVLDKVNHPYLYERSEMSHLSDNRYSQIINNALESGKYEKLIKDNVVTANKVAFIIESAGFEIPESLLDEAIAERKEEVESLVGGFADSKSIFDISEKHNTPVKEIIKQFKKGLKVEREHTKDKKKMGEIVKDHLFENPYYYDVLIKSEKVMEEVDASKFKTHEEYMTAYSEKEKELENMPTEEKANLKARPIIDKIKYSHNQILGGVPEEVELFLRKGILNHFVTLFNEVVSEYIFYTPVWLSLQTEYLTEEQRNKMLMYGIYNNSEYNEESVSKFIDNVIESEMVFGDDNKKLNNIFELLPYRGKALISELEYELNPKDKSLALLLDAFVNKGKILTSTLGVYFDNNGVFASKFSLDIFLKGKRGYLAKQNVEEGVYGISESAKNIFPSYGAKRLSILKDSKANKFFKDYMATYGNEKGKLEKGTSVLTHNDVQIIVKDMMTVYSERAFKNYVKKELIGENPLEKGYQKNLKLKVTTYPMLYIKQGDKLFVVSFSDMIDALTAVIKMDMDAIQFGVSEQGLYISEDVSSFINLEESGIRVSIKSNETEMPHGMLYFDLNRKEFLTNKLEKQEEENPEPKKEEVTSEQFQSRLKVLRKMIEKNPENKSELEVRAKVLEKMISKLSENKMNDSGKMSRGGSFNPKHNFITSLAFKRAMIENGVSEKKANNVIWHLGSEHMLRTKKEIRRILQETNDRHFDFDMPMLEKHKERLDTYKINKIIQDSIYFSKKHSNENNGVIKFKNQYYLTSNDEIKEGDWFYWKDSDGETEFIAQASGITDDTHIQVKSDNEFGYGDWNKDYAKKIIESDNYMMNVSFNGKVNLKDTKCFISKIMKEGGDLKHEYKNDNISNEWTNDIVEYLQGYYGTSKNYNKLFKLIKEVVDMGLRAKSFNSFREFLDYHNPNYHETNKVDNYKNLWWGNVSYLLGNTNVIEKDGVDETFMYQVIGIMDNVVDERQETEELNEMKDGGGLKKEHDSFNVNVKYEVGQCDIDTKGILTSALQKSHKGWDNIVILNNFSFNYKTKNSDIELQLIDSKYDDETYQVIYNKNRDEFDELDNESDVFNFVEKTIKQITYYSYRSIHTMDDKQKSDIKILSVSKVSDKMENGGDLSKEYKYALTIRPFDLGNYPDKSEYGFVRFENGDAKYGYVIYSKLLPIDVINKYSLAPLSEVLTFDGKQIFYYEDYKANVKIIYNQANIPHVEIDKLDENGESIDDKETISALDFIKNIGNGEYREIDVLNMKDGGKLKNVRYRIQNEDGRFLNAGTGIDSWFNLEDARKLVDYEAGQRIVEHDGVSVLWEVF